jgi:hypothetical protein
MQDPAKETPVLTHIQQLVTEEHRLFDKGSLDASEPAARHDPGRARSVLGSAAPAPRAAEMGRDVGEGAGAPADVVEKYVG